MCGRVSPARADGDPASDILLVQNAFFPLQPKVSSSLERRLEGVLAAAARATHVPFKVAIIGSQLDLGLEPQFFGHPQAYASFLDREISFNIAEEPLVTVMPAGFGVVPVRDAPALAHVRLDSRHSSDGLTRSAIAAMFALSRYLGQSVKASPAAPAATSTSSSPGPIVFALPVVLLVLGGRFLVLRRSRPQSGSMDPDE